MLNSISAFYVKKYASGIESSIRVLEHPRVSHNSSIIAVNNFPFYAQVIKKKPDLLSRGDMERLFKAASAKLNVIGKNTSLINDKTL